MKTLLTALFVSLSFVAFSQSPYQISDTTKKWNTVTYGFGDWFIAHCGGTHINKIANEEILNDKVFYKVYETTDSLEQDWYSQGYIWQDTLSNKVYFTQWKPNGDGLIYDFNVEAGDSVKIDNYYVGFNDVTLICDSINFINVNNVTRKHFYFSGINSGGLSDIWIEGIGSKYGLLYSGYGAAGYAGGGMELLCCSKNDTLIYQDTGYNSCYVQEFYPKIITEYFDTAYLDSIYEFQVQISDTANINSWELIGDVIPNDFDFDTNTGILSGLPQSTGSFTCIITIKNNDIGFLTDILYSKIYVVEATKNKYLQNDFNFEIHPNPFSSNIVVNCNEHFNNSYSLVIYNSDGRLVDEEVIIGKELNVNLSDYSDGLYLFIIRDSNRKILKSEKIIKFN